MPLGIDCVTQLRITAQQKNNSWSGRPAAPQMEESKSDGDDGDGDGVQPVIIVQQRPCYIDRVPDDLWKRLALFLAWHGAASLYAGSRAIRTLMLGKWSPHLTVAAECAVLAEAASADNNWRKLGWDSGSQLQTSQIFV